MGAKALSPIIGKGIAPMGRSCGGLPFVARPNHQQERPPSCGGEWIAV